MCCRESSSNAKQICRAPICYHLSAILANPPLLLTGSRSFPEVAWNVPQHGRHIKGEVSGGSTMTVFFNLFRDRSPPPTSENLQREGRKIVGVHGEWVSFTQVSEPQHPPHLPHPATCDT